MRGEVLDQCLGVFDQTLYVDGMRRGLACLAKAGRRASKHRDRALDVAALDMGDADRELGKGLPQCLLFGWPVLPGRLEHLMRVECQAPAQQVLRIGEGFVRRQLEIIRDARNALAARRKWPAELITRTGVSRPAGFIAFTLDHVAIMAHAMTDASESQGDFVLHRLP
jgi:hypothetical protein